MLRTLRYLTTGLALGCLNNIAHAVVIDTFDTGQPAISRTAPTDTGTRVDAWVSGAGILGGERELTLTLNPTVGDGTRLNAEVSGGTYNLNKDSTAGSFSYAYIVWDGVDGSGTVDPNGLSSVDLTEAGSHDAISISVRNNSNPATVYVVADSGFGYSSRAALNLPGGVASPRTFTVPFSVFSTLGFNGPASFDDIGALQLQISSMPAQNLVIDRVQTTSTLSATKRDSLLLDVNNDGVANPGDVLRYTVQVVNAMGDGSGQVDNVMFSDTLDSHTSLVAGSISTTQGVVLSGNNPGDTAVSMDLGTLIDGTTVTLSFDATIDNPGPAGLTQVANQGTVSADSLTTLLTNDPDTGPPNDATVTAVVVPPVLSATLGSTLAVDSNGDSQAGAGDTLLLQMSVTNTGGPATALVFKLPDPANAQLRNDSVNTSRGVVTSGNGAGDSSVEVALGDLPGGASATVSVEVMLPAPLPVGLSQLSVQGQLSGGNFVAFNTDDPGTVAVGDATVVALAAAPPPPPAPGTGAHAIPVTGPAGLALMIIALLVAGARSRHG
ncbi:hypothetical protein [Parahaliea mediterranea]|uniref:hypothetical protein n=1 Tax=Parahaliea mediterranea TaxID=651086 RepID=UPI000E2F7B03|nr:hypothetical protein [Parahaliea mediterranea]